MCGWDWGGDVGGWGGDPGSPRYQNKRAEAYSAEVAKDMRAALTSPAELARLLRNIIRGSVTKDDWEELVVG